MIDLIKLKLNLRKLCFHKFYLFEKINKKIYKNFFI